VKRALAIALATAVAHADPTPEQLSREVTELEAKVAATPGDVDSRMALAMRLAWLGQRDDAIREAKQVLVRAPRYADAYVLLARIAAWNRKFAEARDWLGRLEKLQPLDKDALLVRADSYIWEGHPDLARPALAATNAPLDKEVLQRRLQIEFATRHYWDAHNLADKLLTIDPANEIARGTFEDTRRLSAGIDITVGRFPVPVSSQQLALGVTPTLVAFPRNRLSVTAEYDYDHRFATDNHRFALRGDWRPTEGWTLTGFARTGWVSVVPRTTLYAGAQWEPRIGYYISARYAVDVMSWPGQLHRVIVGAGTMLPYHLHLDLGVSGGLFDYCGKWQTVAGYDATLQYIRPTWQIGVKYAHGAELDRPVLSAFLVGMYGENACPADLGSNAAMLDLENIQSDDVAILPMIQLDRRSALGVGYTYERRENGTVVHTGGIALRRTF
jgi:tetratricopeptide (TPR) repeat protein